MFVHIFENDSGVGNVFYHRYSIITAEFDLSATISTIGKGAQMKFSISTAHQRDTISKIRFTMFYEIKKTFIFFKLEKFFFFLNKYFKCFKCVVIALHAVEKSIFLVSLNYNFRL